MWKDKKSIFLKTKIRVFSSNVKYVTNLRILSPKIITNTELWESNGEKPVISLNRMIK